MNLRLVLLPLIVATLTFGCKGGGDLNNSDALDLDSKSATDAKHDRGQHGDDGAFEDDDSTEPVACELDQDCDKQPKQCHEFKCLDRECTEVLLENDAPCSDGDRCTGPDTCLDGDCISGPAIDCDDKNPCTLDSCKPETGCTNTPSDTGETITCGIGECFREVAKCTDGVLNECIPGDPTDEICDGKDNDCDGQTDEDNPEGGQDCDTELQGVCAIGTTTCKDGTLVCNQTKQPTEEICDGKDNNCDGRIDEDNPGGGQDCVLVPDKLGVCSAATMVCIRGAFVCTQTTQASVEKCNGLDDDCDGETDEDVPEDGQNCDTGKLGVCKDGKWSCADGLLTCNQTRQPTYEACDNLDNDCDGETDEDVPEDGQNCDTRLKGVCKDGKWSCRNGSLACEQKTPSSKEICDGLDNDCDGETDESFPEDGENCDTGMLGVCKYGRRHCSSGKLRCWPIKGIEVEKCDGLDNDCDGETDESFSQDGRDCDTGKPGICQWGTWTCIEGALNCTQKFETEVEVCDGRDNDCDGETDELGSLYCTTYYRDRDGDGYGAYNDPSTCECRDTPPAGYVANPTDCCDLDSRVHTGVTDFFATKNNCNNFDYNCDGNETIQELYTIGTCMKETGYGGTIVCHYFEGWLYPVPECGETGAVITACNKVGNECRPETRNEVQPCR